MAKRRIATTNRAPARQSHLAASPKVRGSGVRSAKALARAGPTDQAMPDRVPVMEAVIAGPPVVGIGASAGGLEAFTRLMSHVAPDSGLAYVLVQHLDPKHPSLLSELLARSAAVPIHQVQDGVRMEPDHAYVIPPNTSLTVTDGHLRLAPRKLTRGRHMPIDDLLRSLAQTHGSGAIGVILSGAGSDGMLGIEAIQAQGGITMAQDTASAGYPSMPQSAASTGHVDFVLSPEEIAERLTTIGRHIGENPATTATTAATDEARDADKIFLLLRNRSGVDFRHYRRSTMQRRILRRMLLHRQDTRTDYLAHLRANPLELDALYDDLLIGVTRFFRDPQVFAALADRAFAEMLQQHPAGAPVRVWVAGCSGGEETYSMAIALLEFLGKASINLPIQIFATDLSDAAIARARAGRYAASIEADVSADRLQRFFVKEDDGYRIAKPVRDLCVFSRHNVLRDPPFSHLDLISCRNVLIYIEPSLQKRVLGMFHYALEPGGVLLLGSAESTAPAPDLFSALDKRHKLYQPLAVERRRFDFEVGPRARRGATAGSTPSISARARDPFSEDVRKEADRLVLARFGPAGVVINENLEVVQFRGRTSGFLDHTAGVATLNLLKLAHDELVAPLRKAIRRATEEGRTAREVHTRLGPGNVRRDVRVEVMPLRLSSSDKQFFVVLFDDQETAAVTPKRPAAAAADGKPSRPAGGRTRAANAVREVREELATARRYIQDLAEEYETANEELRDANEEIQSSNEEFQSTNEELETAKEEIQSTNEELTTLNAELSHRNWDLTALSSDLANVLTSTHVPIVIVGRDMRLRRFTPATERVMRIIPSDTGRPLGDIKLRVGISDLEQQILKSIESLEVTEDEVKDDDGRWWSLTIRPYRTVDQKVDGAVLVFADIDAAKRYGERAEITSESRRALLVAAEQGQASANEARTAAEVANLAKSAFLAAVSHDLRTPLNAIDGYVDLLELGIRGPVTEAQLADYGRIKRSSRYLLSLINDLLNFVKLEGGHVEFRTADVPIRDVVAELDEIIAQQLQPNSLVFHRDPCNEIVLADPEKLRQILLNLLANAIKFTPAGGEIRIGCSAQDATVRIEVSDSGIGIAPDELERIFEPFVQINQVLTTPGRAGVGLGLAISRDLARRMSGDLTVASVVGEGSQFTLTLPRGRRAGAEPQGRANGRTLLPR